MQRKLALFLVLGIMTIASVAARGGQEPGALVSTEEASRMALRGDALLVDVRSQVFYVEGHIAGAVSAPINDIAQDFDRLVAHDKTLIFYCTCPDDITAIAASDEMIRLGFDDVLVLRGGMGDWVREGRPVRAGGRP